MDHGPALVMLAPLVLINCPTVLGICRIFRRVALNLPRQFAPHSWGGLPDAPRRRPGSRHTIAASRSVDRLSPIVRRSDAAAGFRRRTSDCNQLISSASARVAALSPSRRARLRDLSREPKCGP